MRFLVISALVVMLVGCGADRAHRMTGTNPSEKPLRFAFITCAVDAKFFGPVKKGMHDASQMMDVESDFLGTEGVDIPAQVEMVRQAVRDGYDGIALNIIDAEAFDAVIKESIAGGVPVVGFNVDDNASPNARLSSVNQRLYEAGKTLALEVLSDIPENSHVLMTMHDEGVSALEDRLRGLQDVLKTKDVGWTVIVTGNDSARGADRIAEVLRKHEEIHIVLGTGQSDTEAAGLAIEKHLGGREYWSAGFDLSETTLRLVKAGVIRCTVDQQPYIQGFYPVMQLALYCRYQIQPSDIDAGAAIIDARNVDAVIRLTQEGYR